MISKDQPNKFEIVTSFRSLPTAKRQWVKDPLDKEEYLLYILTDNSFDAKTLKSKFSKLKHPCLAAFSYIFQNQIFYHYPSGLTQLNRSPKLDATSQMKVILGLASALYELHQNDIIHGNLSFSSVFVSPKGRTMLTDFGLYAPSCCQQHVRFKAPELLKCVTEPTMKSDVYSFGVFVYKLIGGMSPFKSKDSVFDQNISFQSDAISDKFMSFILLCFQTVPKLRPSMEEILLLLLEDGMTLKNMSASEVNSYKKKIIPKSIKSILADKHIQEYKKRAENGDGQCMVKCADIYQDIGDYEKAINYYQMAVQISNREALWKLGHLYENGLGVRLDKKMARMHYEKSARQDSPMGCFHYGRVLRLGIGCQCDSSAAKNYLLRARDFGVGEAYFLLSDFATDPKEKKELLMKASEQNYPPAQFKVGMMTLSSNEECNDPKKREEAIKLIRKAAKNEEVIVGEAVYEYGKIVYQANPEKGVKLMKRAADVHCVAEAAFTIGCLYKDGQTLPQSIEKAAQYFKAAAKKRHPEALYRYAVFLASGIGMREPNRMKGNKYLTLASQAKVPAALFLVGQQYLERGETDIALNYIKEAADLKLPEAISKYAELTVGNPNIKQQTQISSSFSSQQNQQVQSAESQFLLGQKLLNGDKTTKDVKQGLELIKSAADNGDLLAMFELGKMYFYGQHLPQNAEYAAYYIKSSADKGCADAAFMLYQMLKDGSGVQQNIPLALSYCQKAANANSTQAMFEYGAALQQGTGGLQINLSEAAKYYKLAADMGNALAQYSYAACVEFGAGEVQQSPQEALRYYLASAQQGFAAAQFKVGWFLETGYGLNANRDEAISYYKAAAKGGSQEAIQRLQDLHLSI